jgi:hypothetical protein
LMASKRMKICFSEIFKASIIMFDFRVRIF